MNDAIGVVQNTPRIEGGRDATDWSWGRKKRRVFDLTLQGMGTGAIAERLGVHRNTVRNWFKRPGWREKFRRELEEERFTTKVRRIQTVSSLTDKLWLKTVKALEASELNYGEAAMFLRERLKHVELERELLVRQIRSSCMGMRVLFGC